MPGFLTLSKADQKTAIEQAAAQKGWAAASVEKDFWVCWTLDRLFAMPLLQGHLTFKGGTSLSKAWGLIDRFSEDIDLTIDREALGFGGEHGPEQAASNKQKNKRLKALRQACADFVQNILLPELAEQIKQQLGADGWSLTLDKNDPDGQTLLFEYPTQYAAGVARYIRPVVKIEFGARSDPWPVRECLVKSVIAEAFSQLDFEPSIAVRALAPERTFWEKVMLLHEEASRPAGKPLKPRMARHYYDLFRLIEAGVGKTAAEDTELFRQVLEHRSVFFAQSWIDYRALNPGLLAFLPSLEQEENWREDFVAMQAEMFSTEPPAFEQVLSSIKEFQDSRLK
jgi:predicted nucleotidyltransferase component of viral defense system